MAIGRLNPNLADLPLAVHLFAFQASILVIKHVGQVLLRPSSEGLLAFGRVDGCYSDLMLRVVGVEDGDGVTIVNPNHSAGEGGGVKIGSENCKENESKNVHTYVISAKHALRPYVRQVRQLLPTFVV